MLLRKSFLSLLLLWPPLHLGLSRSDHFSAWRFGGWGMYATPYPTPAQHPLAILLDFRQQRDRDEPPRPLAVFAGGSNVSEWLREHAGLSFLAAGGGPDVARLDLGERSVLSELIATSKAVRQLDRKSQLRELGLLIEQRLVQTAAPPHRVYLSFGTQRADALSGLYGIERQIFSCCDRLEAELTRVSLPQSE